MAQKLTEQFIKMQKLAGIITESQAVEAISTLNEALNKDIKAFGQDLDKQFKAAGFDTLVTMQDPTQQQLQIVKTNPKAVIFHVFQTPETQQLSVYVNPTQKPIAAAEKIINKYQLSDYNGPVLKRGWTAKQVQGAINPGDIVKQDNDKMKGMWFFYRLAKVSTQVKTTTKEAYEKPNIDPGKVYIQDIDAVYKAMEDAIQAQRDIKQLINFRVPVDKQKELKKYYLDKMKHERVMYPGLFEAKTEENLKEGKIADFAKNAIKGVENILKQNLVAASNVLDELIDRGRITPEQAKQTLMNDDFRKEIKKVEMQKGSLARYSNTAIWRKVSDWVNDNYPKD